MSSRKFLVGGNWKMNGSNAMVSQITGRLLAATQGTNAISLKEVQVVIAPPAAYLTLTKEAVSSVPEIQVACQNVHSCASGAFTGEMSADMLLDLGIQWTLLGHSERRQHFAEDDALIGKKCQYALQRGLQVILCIGERLEQRESGQTDQVIRSQLDACLAGLQACMATGTVDLAQQLAIAYEPVWAIGTGKVATPEQAQQAHEVVRAWMAEKLTPELAQAIRVIYGGSVTGDNCVELAGQPDIDGFLVGGASLKADFIEIIRSMANKHH